MILVDTSVWIDHFRREDAELSALLENDEVITHELVIQELACGHIPTRSETLSLLGVLPKAINVRHEEVLLFLERGRLAGSGIGCVDAHLLASASLAGALLLTRDQVLKREASRLKLLKPSFLH